MKRRVRENIVLALIDLCHKTLDMMKQVPRLLSCAIPDGQFRCRL